MTGNKHKEIRLETNCEQSLQMADDTACNYLLLTVRDVTDATPRKGFIRIKFTVGAVDVKTLSIHSK